MVAGLSLHVVMIVMVMTMMAMTVRGTALRALDCRTVAKAAPQPHDVGRQEIEADKGDQRIAHAFELV